MEALNLTLPRQHDLNDPTVERDAGRLRVWLSDLPIMDVAETVRRVLGALDALNEQKLDDGLRFESLEAYRVTVQRLFLTLDPLHLRQLALSKTRRGEAIEGLARLFRSLAGGYKLVVVARHARDGAAPSALLGQAINRALEQLTYALLDNYRFYREVEPQLVAESHALYRLARRLGLLETRVESDNGQPRATTAMLYHASMLAALLEPAQLAEGEVGLLFEVLMQHAACCRVIPGGSWEGSGAGLYVLDLHGDGLPQSCVTLQAPVAISDPFLLDAREALGSIRRRLERTPQQVRKQCPEATLLRSLLPKLPRGDRRGEPRRKVEREVRLLAGLNDIHAWSLINGGSDAVEDERSAVVTCRLLDSSPHGMKLSWQQGKAGDARVGELLGVLDTSAEGRQLYLAVVRTVRVLLDGGMETGIQLFPGSVAAVTCGFPGHADAAAVHALFMPAQESGVLAATLLVARGLYEQGGLLTIDVGGREVQARAGRSIMATPVFDRFEFAAL